MALHSLYCADVPLRNCSLTHSSLPNHRSQDIVQTIIIQNVLCHAQATTRTHARSHAPHNGCVEDTSLFNAASRIGHEHSPKY